MTRRLLFAGTALTASLLPACMSTQSNPQVKRPSVHSTVAEKATSGGVVVSKTTKKSESFAERRTDAPLSVAAKTVPIFDSEEKAETPPIPAGPALPDFTAVEHKTLPVAPPIVAEQTKPIAESTPIVKPVEKRIAIPDPVPDADGIIRASDPVIRTGALPLVEMPTIPKSDPPTPLPTQSDFKAPALDPVPKIKFDDVPPVLAPAPAIKPPMLPSGVIGSSQSNATPDVPSLEPMLAPAPIEASNIKPVSATGESALLQAVRAYQQKRPEEAVEHLKSCDPSSQQMLLSLMPALVRLSEGKLAQMKPEEMDLLLEQLTQAPNHLRSKASLKASNVRLCREVHNFAHVEPFPEKHVFRPGDIVYLYLELANFSCVGDPKSGFAISLVSNLELRDSADKVVWKADPKEEPDRVSTPPQDYYRNFRLCVPSVAPGTYSLRVKSTDQPTGRMLEKSVAIQIGSK